MEQDIPNSITPLERIRQTVGISPTDLASAAKLSERRLYNYRFGKRKLPLAAAVPLARALGCGVEELNDVSTTDGSEDQADA